MEGISKLARGEEGGLDFPPLIMFEQAFKSIDDLADFVTQQRTFADSPKSWRVDVAAIDPKTFDLAVENPTGKEEITHRSPRAIMDEIAALDVESAEVLRGIRELLGTEVPHD